MSTANRSRRQLDIKENNTIDRTQWSQQIHVADGRPQLIGTLGLVGLVTLDFYDISKSEDFHYLCSIISKDGEIADDVDHKIKVSWPSGELQLDYYATNLDQQNEKVNGREIFKTKE